MNILICYLATMAMLVTGTTSTSQDKGFSVDKLTEKTASIATSFMESLTKHFPESNAHATFNMDEFLAQNAVVGQSMKEKFDTKRSSKMVQEEEFEPATPTGGIFASTLSTDSNIVSRTAENKDGMLFANNLYYGQPDPEGNSAAAVSSMSTWEGSHSQSNTIQHLNADGDYQSWTSSISYCPASNVFGGVLDSYDGSLGLSSVSLWAIPVNETRKEVHVTMGPYLFKVIYDVRIACASYQWCNANGCNVLR